MGYYTSCSCEWLSKSRLGQFSCGIKASKNESNIRTAYSSNRMTFDGVKLEVCMGPGQLIRESPPHFWQASSVRDQKQYVVFSCLCAAMPPMISKSTHNTCLVRLLLSLLSNINAGALSVKISNSTELSIINHWWSIISSNIDMWQVDPDSAVNMTSWYSGPPLRYFYPVVFASRVIVATLIFKSSYNLHVGRR